MATMTVTITGVPTFSRVNPGYQFTGTVSLPKVVSGGVRINSMKLAFGYGRTYKVGPYLTCACGDTTFRTDYFTISDTGQSALKERNLNVNTITAGSDHLLKQNGRVITFTVTNEEHSDGGIDRPRAGNMTLTVDYTVLESGLGLNKTRVNAGAQIKATITPGDGAYTHQLTFSLGEKSQTIALAAGVTARSFKIPLEWLDQMPSAVEMEAACTLKTYSGSTLLGSAAKSFTVLCPADILPTCQVSAAVENGFNGKYLSGRSKVLLTLSNAAGAYGSTVTGYQLAGAGYFQKGQSAAFGPLPAGEHTFTASVTDSRGRTGQASVTVSVVAYSSPTLTGVEIYRSDSTGAASETGAYIACKATANYSNLDGLNTASLKARYRVTSGSWVGWAGLTSGVQKRLGGALSATLSYEAQIQITDTVGNTASFTRRIPTASVAFHLMDEGAGAAFGMYQEKAKRLSIPEDWRYYRGQSELEAMIKSDVVTSVDGKKGAALTNLTVYYTDTTTTPDDLTVPWALIRPARDVSGKLRAMLGNTNWCYINTIGYSSLTPTSNRMQVAHSYDSAVHRVAVRHGIRASGASAVTWTDWEPVCVGEPVNIVKLWTNASPTSTFGATTIAKDLTEYAAVIIRTRWSTSAAQMDEHVLTKSDVKHMLRTSSAKMAVRNVTVSDTGVIFEAGRILDTYAGSLTDNDGYVIPAVIYGLKGALS